MSEHATNHGPRKIRHDSLKPSGSLADASVRRLASQTRRTPPMNLHEVIGGWGAQQAAARQVRRLQAIRGNAYVQQASRPHAGSNGRGNDVSEGALSKRRSPTVQESSRVKAPSFSRSHAVSLHRYLVSRLALRWSEVQERWPNASFVRRVCAVHVCCIRRLHGGR